MFSFFKRHQKPLFEELCDIHNHLLPGIDDGSKDINTSAEMLNAFKALGIRSVIPTPHIYKELYPNTPETIKNAFKLLKKNNINRTAYNIIGLPDQNEQSIIETIKFNIKLAPDVSSVAYYSKYDGTDLTKLAKNNFEKNTRGMDAQIRSKIINHNIDSTTLEFYKMNFNILIKNKLKGLEKLKSVWLDKLS